MSWNPLNWLEWLSKYGLIDILFGIGILGYLKRLFHRKTVSAIDGVEVLPHPAPEINCFEIEVRNTSNETLYVYRAYFKPGYSSDKFLKKKPITLFLKHWANDKFPDIEETEKKNKNDKGEYVLSPFDQSGDVVRTAFLEKGVSAFFRLKIKPNGEMSELSTALDEHQAGKLTLHLVHGTKPNILETQL